MSHEKCEKIFLMCLAPFMIKKGIDFNLLKGVTHEKEC